MHTAAKMRHSNQFFHISVVTVLSLLVNCVYSVHFNITITENTVEPGQILQDLGLNGGIAVVISPHTEILDKYFFFRTSVVSVRRPIDREDIAEQVNGVSGTFRPVELRVTYVTLDIDVVLVINILDQNDNVPMFTFPTARVEISEASAEAEVTLSQAIDLDEGLNSIRNYTLTDSLNGLFTVTVRYNPETNAISEVRLGVTRQLDRESESGYVLQLVALEGNENPQTAVQTLNVSVRDVCDIAPTFLTTRYFPENIPENATLETIIFNNLTVMDGDQNERIRYSIYEVCRRPEDSHCEIVQEPYPFTLDAEQGALILNEELDYEEYVTYEVSVHAIDKCNMMNSATIVVTVEDVNDNAPVIVPFIGTILESDYSELNEPKTFGFFTISDQDSGQNGNFSLQLYEEVNGELVTSNTFQLVPDGSHMSLQVIRSLDREEQSNYIVVLIATDFGSPRLSTRRDEIVTVDDSNDNAPIINRQNIQAVYEFEERFYMNQLILTVQASDADDSSPEKGNGIVTYYLPESNQFHPFQHLFVIETETGQLKLNGNFDREMQESLFVVVIAFDNPTNSRDARLNDTIRINITLRDTNDNPPEIHFPQNVFEVSENFTTNRKLFTVNATDRDSPMFATLTYVITVIPNDGRFVINEADLLLGNNRFDYETNPEYTIDILVSDGSLMTNQNVTLSILNTNDEPPVFSLMSQNVVVNIREGSQSMGFLVTTIDVTDPDGMNENIRLNFVSGNDREHFEINEETRQITTTTVLDKETVANYTLLVRAFDGLLSSVQDAVIIVNVLDVNDNEPFFIGTPYMFQVNEENLAGTVVRGPADQEIEADDLDTGENGEIIFDITGAEPPEAEEWFLISEVTGRITTKIPIDRETANLGADGIVQLQVRARNPAIGNAPPLSQSISVNIKIIDISDENPTFPERIQRISLPENLETGATFFTAHAVDLDLSPYNLTRYSIVELTPTITSRFSVGETSGVVTLIGTLDFETEQEVRLTIRAVDSDNSINFDELLIIINVTDTEDPCLCLKGFNPAISIAEHSPLNTLILSFEATNLNGHTVTSVVYDLVNYDGTPSAEFAISEDSNFMANIHTTTMNIDRETLVAQGNSDATYTLNITARDPVSSALCETLRSFLTITITDINDNRPSFASEMYSFELAENSPSGTLAGQIIATDIDQGSNSIISYRINDPNVPFTINSDGEIESTTNQINRDPPEGTPVYTFSVNAQDNGDIPMFSSTTVTVHITDENDNSPVFGPERRFFVFEDRQVNEKIGTIIVTDNDEGDFGRVTLTTIYANNLSPDGHFQLVSNDIFLRLPLDRDIPGQEEYSFEVIARDGGGRSDTAEIIIEIMDVNDNPPEFNLEPLTATISENQPTGSENVIATVSANDRDDGLNAAVRFEIADSSLKHTFCILQNVGDIFICPSSESTECTNPVSGVPNTAIDFERQQNYGLDIVGYEQANPRHFVFKTINVGIIDVNEHAPTFDSESVSVVVNEDIESGAVVLPIRAYDLDTSDSALTYTVFENGVTSQNFRYQLQEGAIVTSIPLNYNLQDQYILTLRAQESVPSNPHHTTIIVNVFVRNVNDRVPVFDTTLFPTATQISETIKQGIIILTVHATDADNATYDAVYYEVESGNIGNAFSIDSLTGDIMVASPLDFDSVQSYSLSVVAKDTGDPQQQTSQTITITIDNVNDEMPIFTESLYEFDFVENSPIGTIVGRVDAPDHDFGEFGRVTYSLLDGETGYFTVEPDGDVVSLVEIDREMTTFTSRRFRVMATDGGQPPMSSITDVMVRIIDTDDNSPTFSRYQYYIYQTAMLRSGETIFELANVVDDEDIRAENREFTFELTSVPGNLFSVSPSGVVSLRAALPSPPLSLYEAQVIVLSTSNHLLNDTAYLRLAIEGDNDHHPMFNKPEGYTTEIREDRPATSIVFNFSDDSDLVTDPDDGPNGVITFMFQEHYPLFEIESSQGLVTLLSSLDYEETKTHILRVGAVDGNGRISETTLTVTVLSANDEKPYFEDPPVRLVLSPVPRVDIDLFTLVARDDDEGDDGKIQYRLLTNDNDTSVYFTIDQELGIVRSKGMITAGNSVDIRVTAYDLGTPPQTTDIIIQIVFQIPNSAPSFVGIDTTQYTIPVDEDHPESAVYMFATQPQNSLFRLVHTNAPDDLFSVSKSLGNLNLHGPLNFNARNSYEMYIEAYIEDTTNLENIIRSSTYLRVIIDVVDINDNAPIFARSMETISLRESATFSEPIFTARAFDEDSGIFSQLNYAIISGNTARVFGINATSGDISVLGTLDRETQSSYDLTIRAFDLSTQPLSTELRLHIEVEDINDNAPSFIRDSNYSIGVYEYPHTQSGARILRLPATDPDIGPISYQLYVIETRFRGSIIPNPPAALFEIQFDTATITLSSSAQLDYETIDYTLLRIEADDRAFRVSTFLSINILDVNENAPVLSVPDDVEIWEQQPVNSFVTQVTATDADNGISGVVTYTLEDDNFEIDPYTGTIRNKGMVKATLRASLNTLTVNATDQGNPPKVTSTRFSFRTLDINDNPPVFDTQSYVFAVSMTAQPAAVFGQFSASDSDYAENSGIEFSIPHYYNEAGGLFEIKTSNHVSEQGTAANLTLRDLSGSSWQLRPRNYTFQLEAANNSPNPSCAHHFLSSYANVTVVVYPECPTFNYSMYTVTVLENEQVLNDATLTATSFVGRPVEYALNDSTLPFLIEKTTGRLMLVRGLDREMRENYAFEVIATDSVFQPRTCSVTVTVTVIDVNDNKPMFVSNEHNYIIMENTRSGHLINTIEARDIDIGDNRKLTYAIDNLAADVPFRIESTTGRLLTNGVLDAEIKDSYSFMVIATDRGVPPLSNSILVNVTIGDVNEDPPTFTMESFNFPSIEPSSMRGDVVAVVTARDSDIKAQLTFKFSNEPPKQYFRINSLTGEIILNVSARNPSVNKRSVQKRQVESEESNYFTVPTEVEVSDGTRTVKTSFELTLHNSFQMVSTDEPVPNETYIIIAVVVASVLAVIAVFFCLLIVACICKYRRANKRVQIKDSRPNNDAVELSRFSSRRSQNSRSSTPGQNKQLSTTMFPPTGHAIRHSSGSRSNSSEQSYSNYADDELDSNNEMTRRSAYNSPGLSKRPPANSAHARSTSDLASSIGTDMLGSQQLPHPKAKIAAIYAAHHGLLNNHGSQESIHSNHTFASEGGGEADAEADIDNMLYQKYEFDDDEDMDDETTIPDDSSYMGKDQPLTNSVGNLDVPPVEDDISPYGAYSQPGVGEWIPRATPMEHTINELSEMAYSSSQEHHIPVPRYMEHSQPVSMYGASSQGSHLSLLPRHRQQQHAPPRHYEQHTGQQMRNDYDFYGPPPQEPLRHNHGRPQPRYSSATALPEYNVGVPRELYNTRGVHHVDPRLHQSNGHHRVLLSQDVPPTYMQQSRYIQRGVNAQTPSSDTPTEGTVTPLRAMTQEYDPREYMSSSSTSLGSTNLSGTTSSIGASASQRIYSK